MRRIFRGSWSLFLITAACSQPAAPPAAEPVPPAPTAEPAAPVGTAVGAGTEPSRTLTPEACQARGGQVMTDPGDGSLRAKGCPEGGTLLGDVRIGLEGGLCCSVQAAGTSPVEGPSVGAGPQGKRAPCTFGADQTCNADPAVSSIHGRCTEVGTCVCKAPAVLTPGGFCKVMP
jgi:hypothetical protein